MVRVMQVTRSATPRESSSRRTVIVRMAATCVCGSDYRGINPITQPKPMGHEQFGKVAPGVVQYTTGV
jgi:threonine dehydrogenase-like Zn-dependent dehydrogenase